MTRNTIYCFGIINLDILVYPLDGWPEPGGLVPVDHVVFTPGGTALNTALTIQKLGLNAVELLGCVGDDDAGNRIYDQLVKDKVGVGGLTRTAATNSGVCIVTIQSSGERSFLYSAGANDAANSFSAYLERISEGCMVHLGGVLDMAILGGEDLVQIVDALKEKACFISMDLAWDWRQRGWESLRASLRRTDVVSLNEQEAINLTGERDLITSAEKIFTEGCPFVIIKLGNRGAYVHRQDFQGIIPGFAVTAVDTTGAGDAFSGALLVALSNNEPPLQAVHFANAEGACCVQKIGPSDGVRSYSEVLKFIEAQEQSFNIEDQANEK